MSLVETGWPGRGRTAVVPGAVEGPHVLAPRLGPDDGATLAVARCLARGRDADLLVLEPECPQGGGPLASNVPVTVSEQSVTDDGREPVRETVRPGGTVASVIERATESDAVDAVVLRRDGARALGRFELGRAAARADCDAVVLNGPAGLDRVGSVLFAVAGGPHSPFAAELARHVAAAHDAWVDVMHVLPPGADGHRRALGEAYVAGARRLLDGYDRVDHWLVEDDDPADVLVEQSRYYDATVLGAPTEGRLRRFVFGSTTATVRTEARGPVLMARRDGVR